MDSTPLVLGFREYFSYSLQQLIEGFLYASAHKFLELEATEVGGPLVKQTKI